jgi:programmed cell death protein 4
MGKLKSAHGNADAVRRLIRASMDHRPAKRELTSRALVGLASAKVVSLHAISAAFSRLLDDLDDVTKDVPAAGKMLSTFMARAVVDDCLPPAFLSDERFDAAGTVVRDARLLLTVPARTVRLSHAWGFAMEDVDTLKHYVRLLVEEFMSTGDGVEAAQCVRELDAPLFMHELVKRAVVLAIDKSEELQMLVSDLLQYLVITLQLFGKREVSIGFHRVRAELDSLTLDAPSAPTVFNEFVERAIADDILPASFPEDDFAEAAASNPFAAEAAAVAAAAAEEAGEDETEASAAQ